MWPLQHIHLQRQETASWSVIAVAGHGRGAQTPGKEEFLKWFLPPAPGVCVWYGDPDCMRGYGVRCGTSGLIHSSDWVPGLSLLQMLLPRERGKLTVVPRVSGIFRTSEWKGCAICEKHSFISHVFLGTRSGSDPMWTQAMV